MFRERVLTISTLLALVALSGVAQAEPKITDKGYGSSQVGPSSRSTTRQTERDWYRARAMQSGAPPAQIVREGPSLQTGCRYLYSGGASGPGPKGPVTC
jgi:hypothetical protein